MGMVLLWNDRQRINEYITSLMLHSIYVIHFSLSVATENTSKTWTINMFRT